MYEKSDKYRLHQAILDHPDNVARDAYEKYLLNKKIERRQIEKLRQELGTLKESGGPAQNQY